MKFSELKGFIFDFDGTLVDSHPAILGPYIKGFKAIGRECDAELVHREMHFALRQMVTHFDMSEEEKQICADTIRKEIDNPEEWHKAKLFDDTLAFLKILKANGKHMGVVSGSREYHIRDVLSYLGVLEYFDFIVGGDLSRPSKPNPDVMYIALDHWEGFNKSEVVYIGDSLQDPETASNAGIYGCLLDRNDEFQSYKGLKIKTLLDLTEM